MNCWIFTPESSFPHHCQKLATPSEAHNCQSAHWDISFHLWDTGISFQLPLELQWHRAFWFLLANKPVRPEHQHCWSSPAHPPGLAPAVLQPVPPHHPKGLPSAKGQLHILQRKYSILESSTCTLLFSASTSQFHSDIQVFDSHHVLQLQGGSAEFSKWFKGATEGWLVLGGPSAARSPSEVGDPGRREAPAPCRCLGWLHTRPLPPARAPIDFSSSSRGNSQEENYFLLSSSAGVCLAKGLISACKFYQYSLRCIIKVAQPPIVWKIL